MAPTISLPAQSETAYNCERTTAFSTSRHHETVTAIAKSAATITLCTRAAHASSYNRTLVPRTSALRVRLDTADGRARPGPAKAPQAPGTNVAREHAPPPRVSARSCQTYQPRILTVPCANHAADPCAAGSRLPDEPAAHTLVPTTWRIPAPQDPDSPTRRRSHPAYATRRPCSTTAEPTPHPPLTHAHAHHLDCPATQNSGGRADPCHAPGTNPPTPTPFVPKSASAIQYRPRGAAVHTMATATCPPLPDLSLSAGDRRTHTPCHSIAPACANRLLNDRCKRSADHHCHPVPEP